MLGISERSTQQELTQAYEEEARRLEAITPSTADEAKLLEAKRSALETAYHTGLEAYQGQAVMPVADESYAAYQQEDLKYYEGFLKSVMAKLSNERFVQNAPEKVVANERAKQADAEAKITAIKEQLTALK